MHPSPRPRRRLPRGALCLTRRCSCCATSPRMHTRPRSGSCGGKCERATRCALGGAAVAVLGHTRAPARNTARWCAVGVVERCAMIQGAAVVAVLGGGVRAPTSPFTPISSSSARPCCPRASTTVAAPRVRAGAGRQPLGGAPPAVRAGHAAGGARGGADLHPPHPGGPAGARGRADAAAGRPAPARRHAAHPLRGRRGRGGGV